MTKALREMMERAEEWPREVQEAATETLRVIERGRLGAYKLTDEDRAALRRSASDVRRGKFASSAQVSAFFKRIRA